MHHNKTLDFVMKEYPDVKNLAGKDGEEFFKSYKKFKGEENNIDICQAWIGATQVEHEHLRDDFTDVRNAVKLKNGCTLMDVAMLITFAHIKDVPQYYWPYLQAMRNETGETEQEG